jgi:hypothetical protein
MILCRGVVVASCDEKETIVYADIGKYSITLCMEHTT